MAKVKFYPFTEDIIRCSLYHIENNTLLIYPTRSSANQARMMFQSQWALQHLDFITMDELKTRIFRSELPVLEDEKRLLCLYSVLSQEDKEHFHINSYDDIIVWGLKWFEFFTELTEELVNPETLMELDLLNGFYLQSWQEDYIERILALRKRYSDHIGSIGFTDKIFLDRDARIELPPYYKSYIFVNQYYYSSMERNVIQQMERTGSQVEILFHGDKSMFDAQYLTANPIDLTTVLQTGDFNTQRIDIIEAKSEEQMISSYFDVRAAQTETMQTAVIDRLFFHKAYRGLFDPDLYGIGFVSDLMQSPVYKMIQTIVTHLGEAITENTVDYIPLRLIRDTCTQQWFNRYFGIEACEEKQLFGEIDRLSRADILYMDTDMILFDLMDNDHQFQSLKKLLIPYFHALKNFSRVSSIKNLLDLLDNDGGLSIQRLATDTELQFSDLLPKLWERSSNFASIENLKIVTDWTVIFPDGDRSVAIGIIQLFLQFLKTATLSYKSNVVNTPKYLITDLMDSRNQSYDNLVVLNALEGEMPQAPSAIWLLNETQRKRLGLKTWEDIRQWERYYFFRLIFSAKHAQIFTYSNQESNVEPSSFIAEMLYVLETNETDIALNRSNKNYSIKELYSQILCQQNLDNHISSNEIENYIALEDNSLCGINPDSPERFFSLPYGSIDDFGEERTIKSGYYALDLLTKNAFAWYVTELRKIRSVEILKKESLSRKVFGTILHEFVALIMNDYIKKHGNRIKPDPAFTEHDYLRNALYSILCHPLNSYKIPKNYNREFLFNVMADTLCDSIKWVFNTVLYNNKDFADVQRIIPEAESMTKEEYKYKELIPPSDDTDGIRIHIHGKADLRIETTNKRYIIDFKTGSGSKDQLLFYEWCYYILDRDTPIEHEIVSMICNLFEHTYDQLKDADSMREKFRERIYSQLASVIQSGYWIAEKVADRKVIAEISRADLYKNRMRSKV